MWCGKSSTGVDSVAVRVLPVVCTEAPDVGSNRVIVDSGSLKTVSNVASAVEGGAAGASSAIIAA